MKKGRRVFAIFMATVMVLALLPTAAFAHDEDIVDTEIEELEVLGAIASDETESDFADATDEEVDVVAEEADEEFGGFAEDVPDDTFGGFAGIDDLFGVDEDAAPIEEDEDFGIGAVTEIALYATTQTRTVTVSWVDAFNPNNAYKSYSFAKNYNEEVTFDDVLPDGIDGYVIIKYELTVTNGSNTTTEASDDFIVGPKRGVPSYKIYVIDATPGAHIYFDVTFVDEEGTELAAPEGYAIGYTATISGTDGYDKTTTRTTSGSITADEPYYTALVGYDNEVIFGEQENLDIPGYEFVGTEKSWASANPAIGQSGPTSYMVFQYAGDDWGRAAFTITNTYKKVATYTVTWLDFTGEVFHTAIVNKGAVIPAEYLKGCPGGTPDNESYTFDGWNEPAADGENYIISANWIAPHTVTVDGVVTQTVKHGTTASEPAKKPEKAGHTFNFWTLDGETAFDFGTPITEDIELTASWTAEKRTVTWTDGEETVATAEVDYGTTVTAPEREPTREGYRFDGWEFDFETEITEDTTISAVWVRQITHTWVNGEDTVDSKTADEGAEVEAPEAPTRSGYTFNGWTSTTDEWGNVTYTAQWTQNSTGNTGNTGGTTGGGNTGGNVGGNDEPVGGGEGGEGSDPADDANDPNEGDENGEDENGGLVNIDDEGPALADRPFMFIDVNENDWFYNAVYTVWEKEMMNGTTATTFAPHDMTTRSMLVTILYRLEGEPEVEVTDRFTDVAADMYYTKAIAWAAENGIVYGETEDTFSPDGIVLREQTAAILYRYAKYKGIDVSVDESEIAFEDADLINEYAQDAMLWAVSTGLMKGKTESSLAPQDGTERSQMATLLVRFMEMAESTEGEADEQ